MMRRISQLDRNSSPRVGPRVGVSAGTRMGSRIPLPRRPPDPNGGVAEAAQHIV
jgi:hypothetical protein